MINPKLKENYDLLRHRAETSERSLSTIQSDLSPLRKEISRLTHENNELHIEAVRLRELETMARHEISSAETKASHALEKAEFFAATQRRVLSAKEAELSNVKKRLASFSRSGDASNRPGGGSNSRSSSVGRDFDVKQDDETSNSLTSDFFLDKIEKLQARLEEVQEEASRAKSQLSSAREGLKGRDEEIARLGVLVAAAGGVVSSSSSSSLDGAPISSAAASAASANARIISQLSEQVDFLTAELAARDAAGLPKAPSSSDPQGLSRSVDTGSRVSALELEVTRLATRLDAASRGKASAEAEASSLRKEVAAIQDMMLQAQASAREAAEAAEASSMFNAASAEALGKPFGPAGSVRVGPTRARSDLANALRELSRLQSEHARMSAAAEAVSMDRERFTRETARLEGALSAANSAMQAQAGAAAAAEAIARTARDDLARSHSETEALKRALGDAKNELEAALRKVGEAERRCDTAGAELASLRPLVNAQASDNERLRAEVTDLRTSLSETTTAARDAASGRDAALAEATVASDTAARSSATQGVLAEEVLGLRRELDALTTALTGAKREEDATRKELERSREIASSAVARCEALSGENNDLSAKLASQARAIAAAQDTANRLTVQASASGEIPALKAELAALQRKVTAAEIAADASARARDRCDARCGDLIRDLEASRASLERTCATLSACERSSAETSRSLADCEAKLSACTADRDHVSELLAQAHAALGRQSVELQEGREELARAREEAVRFKISWDGAEARVEEARKSELAALAEAEAYAAAAKSSESMRLDAERAKDVMAEDLSSALRFAESSGGASMAAKEKLAVAEGLASAANAACAEETAKVARLRGDLDQMKALFIQLDRTRAASDQQLGDSMARIRELTDELALVNRAKSEGSGAMASLHSENERLRAALAASQSEEDNLSSKIDDASRRLSEQSSSVAALQRSLSSARMDLEASSSEALRLTSALASRDRDNAALKASLEEAEKGKRDALGERDVARAESAKSHEDTSVLSNELQRMSFTISSLRQQLSDSQEAHNSSKVSLSQAEAANSDLRSDREVLLQEYRDLEQRWRALEGEVRVSNDLRTRAEAQLAALASEKHALLAQLTREEEARARVEDQCAHFAGENGVLQKELSLLNEEKREIERGELAAKSEAGLLQRSQTEWAVKLGDLERQLSRSRDEVAHASAKVAVYKGTENDLKAANERLKSEISKRDLLLAQERMATQKVEAERAAVFLELTDLRKAGLNLSQNEKASFSKTDAQASSASSVAGSVASQCGRVGPGVLRGVSKRGGRGGSVGGAGEE